MTADVDDAFLRFGYDPDRPVGGDNEIPDRLIRRIQDAPLVNDEALITKNVVRVGKDLSGREIEVLRYLSRGLEPTMVASAIGIELSTVKTHMKAVRFKLRAKNTTQACCDAVRQGLIP